MRGPSLAAATMEAWSIDHQRRLPRAAGVASRLRLDVPRAAVTAEITGQPVRAATPIGSLCRCGPILGRMPIRVVLAEDNYLVREGVRKLLETQEDIEVAAVCNDLTSLLEAVEREQPEVVLTDIRMPPGGADEGIQAAARLRETHPEIGVVVLSQFAEPRYALALLEKGSQGRAYLLKERVHELEQLTAAIQEVAAGGSVIDAKVVDALVAARSRAERSPLADLTPRERQILGEMAQGKNNAAIAASLVITERSVEKVIHSIFQKLGLSWEKESHHRVKAVLLYLAEEQG